MIGKNTKRFLAVLIVNALSVIGLCLALATPAIAQPTQITVLHISDTHSHLAAWGPKDANLDGTLGGLPKAAAIVSTERAADPKALFVHAGDFMEGDLFFRDYLGVPELTMLKSLGLDALVLGNHDFAFGPDFLSGVFQSAWPSGGVPVLGTNLTIPGGSSLSPWVSRSLIKEVNGVKVGLIGLTVRNGARAKPAPVSILRYTDPSIAATVAALRAAGAQVVICVSHMGMISARDLAVKVPGIDVIVNGHDNAVLEQPERVGSTLIVSAGNYYRWVGRLRLSVNGTQVNFVDYVLLGADAATLPLPWVQNNVDEMRNEMVSRYGDVFHQRLALADPELTAEWDPDHAKRDTALGNLFTDAYRTWTGTEIAIEATGWLGDALPAGPIVGADVFRAMSYAEVIPGQSTARPWRLVTFRTTGAALLAACETTLAMGGDYFPQVSGMRMDYDSSVAAGAKILRDTIHIGGHKFVPDQLYTVTVTEGTYGALKLLGLNMQDVQVLPYFAFDAARLLVTLHGELGLATSNRLRDVAVISKE